jgi:hypothetical protein
LRQDGPENDPESKGRSWLLWARHLRAISHPRCELSPIRTGGCYGVAHRVHRALLVARLIRAAGVALIIQVTDLEEARQAIGAGADVIVAQGTEADGHGGRRSTLPFAPVVADRAAPTPVLAAGGIGDGRGVAAALARAAGR